MPPKRFSDFAADVVPLDGEKTRLEDILNKEVLIIGYAINRSKFTQNSTGKCLTIQFEVNGLRQVVFTGSAVLIEQMERYGEQIPFIATIKKIDRYYTLT